jgi:RNA polymerase sigma-70 factor (ECF subfamily)
MTKDQEILNRLKGGDKHALKEFYHAQKPICHAFLAKNFGMNQEHLNDIYQDSVLALYQNIAHGKLTELNSSLSTYLMAIAKNLSLKKVRNGLKVVDDSDKHLEYLTDDFYDDSEDEKLSQAMKAFKAMGEPCKSILEMYYFSKMRMNIIAEKLGYNSPNVAKTQKARCIKTLRNQIISRHEY